MSPDRSKQHKEQRGGSSVSLTTLLMLAVIIAAGVFLRGQAFLGTEVVEPLQAGSEDAYELAQTLSSQGAYQTIAGPFEAETDPAASEAFSGLGYPLFLSLFATAEPSEGTLNAIVITQLVLGALAILLVYMLATRLFDPHWGLIAALLTAVSPFLVNVSLFLVGATLLMVMLLLYLVTTARIKERGTLIRTLIAAALLGLVAWVDPTYQFLILPWLLLLFSSSRGFSKVLIPVAAIIGFALVFAPSIARNQALIDTPIAATPIVESLQQGMPSQAAADAAAGEGAASTGVGGALMQLGGRFIDDPRAFLSWYFVEKPQMLWSVGEKAGIEQSFVYPVSETPYSENPSFLASEEFMQILHGPAMLLGAIGVLLVWLPVAGRRLSDTQRIGLQSISLVVIYATLAHLFGVSAPQYAVPLMPLMFVMALTPLYLITLPKPQKAAQKQQPEQANNEAEPEAA